MFRKKDDHLETTLDNIYVKIENIEFFIDYHLATEYPDTEIGKLAINESEYLSDDFKNKMKANLSIFTDEKYAALDRREKINLFKKRVE